MATITQRPEKICTVGGSFPNPVVYKLTSANPFELITLRTAGAVVLINEIYLPTKDGVCEVDLAGVLTGFLAYKIALQDFSFVDASFSIPFYITGTGFDESANLRYASYAKKDAFDSNFLDYSIRPALTPLAKFTNVFVELPQWKNDVWLSCYNDYAGVLYLQEFEYDVANTLLATTTTLLDEVNSMGYLRVLILASLLTSCVRKDCRLLSAPDQLVGNFHFKNGLTGWVNEPPNLFPTSHLGTFARCVGGGSAKNFVIKQSIVFPVTGIYLFTIKLKTIDAPEGIEIEYDRDGSVFNFVLPSGTQDLVYTETFLGANNTADLRLNIALPASFDLYALDIDFISITLNPTSAVTETKTLLVQETCNPLRLIWLSPLGAWETYHFENYEFGTKTVGSPSEFMSYQNRYENIAQSKQRQTLRVTSSEIPLEHLEPLSTILTSPEVYWQKGETLVYCKPTTNSLPNGSDNKRLYDVVLEFELPYLNS